MHKLSSTLVLAALLVCPACDGASAPPDAPSDASAPLADAPTALDAAPSDPDGGAEPDVPAVDAPAPSGTNAARIDAALEGYVVPFAVAYPADPVTSARVNVDPSSIVANLVAGRALVLAPGRYPHLVVEADDVELIAEAGVTIEGLTVSADRFRITGGGASIEGGVDLRPNISDVMVDGVRMATASEYDTFALSSGVARLAVVRSTLSSSMSWVVIGGDGGSDFVFARDELVYTGPTYSPMRVTGAARVVIVASRFFSNAQGLRIHNTSGLSTSHVSVAGNQFESTAAPPSALTWIDPNNGGGAGADLPMSHVWLVDNRYYREAALEVVAIGPHTPGLMDTITVRGNRAYGAASVGSPMGGISGAMVRADVSDNVNEAYEAPPEPWVGAR